MTAVAAAVRGRLGAQGRDRVGTARSGLLVVRKEYTGKWWCGVVGGSFPRPGSETYKSPKMWPPDVTVDKRTICR